MSTHCDRVLELLKDRKPHTHHELYRLGVIAHSRIADLRKRGWRIAGWTHVENGERVYCYQLVGGPPFERGASSERPSVEPSGSLAPRGSASVTAVIGRSPDASFEDGSSAEPGRVELAAAPLPGPAEDPPQLSLLESLPDVHQVAQRSALAHVDEEYATRLADRVRAEGSHRSLRVVRGDAA